MSELLDGLLVLMTGILALATFYLAYHARKLWQGAKEIADRERELRLLPQLRRFTVQPLEGTKCRFSVKNVGFGYAMNLVAEEILNDGTRSSLATPDQKEFVETGDVFYWDIPNSSVGQQKSIEIKYTDILGEHDHTHTTLIIVI